mgnify:CR=1 FL=1
MVEPEIAIAATPRDWAGRLHRHVTDHGGARVRATILHPAEALTEHYDVLVVDDTTSYLTAHLVSELHQRDRRVLGVYDQDDPAGKGELLAVGVDDVIARTAAAQEFVAAVAALAELSGRRELEELLGDRAERPPPAAVPPTPRGTVVAVGAASGGCGATEVAAALAGGRPDAVLVDADAVAPSLAQRLGTAPYPNLSAAIDALARQRGALTDALIPLPSGAALLPGCDPRQRVDVRAADVAAVTTTLARSTATVVVDVGARLTAGIAEPGGNPGGAVVVAADAVVVVTLATPVGVTRLLDWLADVRALTAAVPLHVVVNRAPASPYRRAEVAGEIRRTFEPASLTFAPHDARVEAAAWAGELVGPGPFTRALAELADQVLPPLATPARRGLWRWRR